VAIAAEAAEVVRMIYDDRAARTYTKADTSPVTDADLAADKIIRQRLAEHFPNDAILTEEGADDTSRLSAARCWIVDPIDGTQQFIDRTGQFDVLIALVIDGRPVVGISAQPTTGLIVSASSGEGAWLERVGQRNRSRVVLAQPADKPRVVTTIWFDPVSAKPYLDQLATTLEIPDVVTLRTGALVRDYLDPAANGLRADTEEAPNPDPAHGMVGLWVREDGTLASEWDYAAPDIIVNEAGGRFTDWTGRAFRYNKPKPRNEGGLVIASNPRLHGRIVSAVEPLIGQIAQVRGMAL
jgi:3'-phosphoadenosine 5'-phosphosulfate (PAPS) 3'-phosphatase